MSEAGWPPQSASEDALSTPLTPILCPSGCQLGLKMQTFSMGDVQALPPISWSLGVQFVHVLRFSLTCHKNTFAHSFLFLFLNVVKAVTKTLLQTPGEKYQILPAILNFTMSFAMLELTCLNYIQLNTDESKRHFTGVKNYENRKETLIKKVKPKFLNTQDFTNIQ